MENILSKVFLYSEISILVFNEDKQLIPLIIGDEINYDKFSKIQKEYISKFTNSKKVLKKRVLVEK